MEDIIAKNEIMERILDVKKCLKALSNDRLVTVNIVIDKYLKDAKDHNLATEGTDSYDIIASRVGGMILYIKYDLLLLLSHRLLGRLNRSAGENKGGSTSTDSLELDYKETSQKYSPLKQQQTVQYIEEQFNALYANWKHVVQARI